MPGWLAGIRSCHTDLVLPPPVVWYARWYSQDDVATFEDLEYCKTDLIASKGVVFCKFSKASSALKALEDISSRGTVSPAL